MQAAVASGCALQALRARFIWCAGGQGGFSAACPGAWHCREGRPADPGVAVQLGSRDRAGRLVRALSTLWQTPQLQRESLRRAVRVPVALKGLLNLLGLALFGLVLYSGFAGAQVPGANFSVTFIYVVFSVGVPVLSVLFGDVFRVLSPWRSCARALVWLRARSAPNATRSRRYPERLGVWAAVVVLVGFAWLELVYAVPDRDRPSTLAALSLGYFVVMVSGMLLFGVEEWGARADGFGACFNLFSRLSAIESRNGVLYLRRPLSATTRPPDRAGNARPRLHDHRRSNVRRREQRRDLEEHRPKPAERLQRPRRGPHHCA